MFNHYSPPFPSVSASRESVEMGRTTSRGSLRKRIIKAARSFSPQRPLHLDGSFQSTFGAAPSHEGRSTGPRREATPLEGRKGAEVRSPLEGRVWLKALTWSSPRPDGRKQWRPRLCRPSCDAAILARQIWGRRRPGRDARGDPARVNLDEGPPSWTWSWLLSRLREGAPAPIVRRRPCSRSRNEGALEGPRRDGRGARWEWW